MVTHAENQHIGLVQLNRITPNPSFSKMGCLVTTSGRNTCLRISTVSSRLMP